jgi:hypothetical protein
MELSITPGDPVRLKNHYRELAAVAINAGLLALDNFVKVLSWAHAAKHRPP